MPKIRIYYESLDQAKYFEEIIGEKCELVKIKKSKRESNVLEALNSRKNFDVIISKLLNDKIEIILAAIELSTSVPTDDHKMQRSDGVYWAKQFRVPFIKISHESSKTDFVKLHGGGGKLSKKIEENVYKNFGAAVSLLSWPYDIDKNITKYHEERKSCPPIFEELSNVIRKILDTNALNQEQYFNDVRCAFGEPGNECWEIPKSKRVFEENGYINIKINRFTHGMDPDKGVVYFYKMAFPSKKIAVFFDFNKSLSVIADTLIKDNGQKSIKFQEEYLKFTRGSIFNILKLAFVGDEFFLSTDQKTIFYKEKAFNFSQILSLSDKLIFKRNNFNDIEFNLECLESEKTTFSNIVTRIRKMTISDYTEDEITFFVSEYLKNNQFQILSVSYPGAQGNLPVLIGSGRTAERKYIDVVAKKDDKLILIESKIKAKDLEKDKIKLKNLIQFYSSEIANAYTFSFNEIIDEYAAIDAQNHFHINGNKLIVPTKIFKKFGTKEQLTFAEDLNVISE